MQDVTDTYWRELDSVASRLITQLRSIIPTHVTWTVRPVRERLIFKWHVEDRLIFEVDFGGPRVDIYEPIRRRPLRGGPWTNLATPEEAAALLLAGITATMRDGSLAKRTR